MPLIVRSAKEGMRKPMEFRWGGWLSVKYCIIGETFRLAWLQEIKRTLMCNIPIYLDGRGFLWFGPSLNWVYRYHNGPIPRGLWTTNSNCHRHGKRVLLGPEYVRIHVSVAGLRNSLLAWLDCVCDTSSTSLEEYVLYAQKIISCPLILAFLPHYRNATRSCVWSHSSRRVAIYVHVNS